MKMTQMRIRDPNDWVRFKALARREGKSANAKLNEIISNFVRGKPNEPPGDAEKL